MEMPKVNASLPLHISSYPFIDIFYKFNLFYDVYTSLENEFDSEGVYKMFPQK
jgi:hypothetical protein